MTAQGQLSEPNGMSRTIREESHWGKLSKSARVLVLSVVFGVVLPGTVLNYGAWDYFYGLRPLKADPMASQELLGLKLVDAWEAKRWESFLDYGNDGGAAIGRYFALEGRDPDQVLNELAQYAQDHGWEGESTSERPNLWWGNKSKTLYKLYLSIWYEYGEDTIKITLS
jgi:hypothetical protein